MKIEKTKLIKSQNITKEFKLNPNANTNFQRAKQQTVVQWLT